MGSKISPREKGSIEVSSHLTAEQGDKDLVELDKDRAQTTSQNIQRKQVGDKV